MLQLSGGCQVEGKPFMYVLTLEALITLGEALMRELKLMPWMYVERSFVRMMGGLTRDSL